MISIFSDAGWGGAAARLRRRNPVAPVVRRIGGGPKAPAWFGGEGDTSGVEFRRPAKYKSVSFRAVRQSRPRRATQSGSWSIT